MHARLISEGYKIIEIIDKVLVSPDYDVTRISTGVQSLIRNDTGVVPYISEGYKKTPVKTAPF